MRLTGLALVGLALAAASPAYAECGIEKGSVRILANDFPALRAVLDAASECASSTVTVKTNATAEHDTIQIPALKVNPAEYTVAVIASGSIVPLLNDDLVRPLDDLVAKYGQQLRPQQLIKIDGKVVAVAFMANAQHLYLRSDLLEKAGVEQPKTYAQVLAAAEKLKASGVAHPMGGTYGAGWDLAEEFVNMYLGHGGEFFKTGTAEPSVNNAMGVKALETMKALSAYMTPEFLSADSNIAQKDWESGQTAMMVLWGSRAGSILDDEGSTPEVTANTVLAAAPSAEDGGIPATTVWWDGFAIAKNISDEDAEASFRAMMHGLTKEMANAHAGDATWLIEGFTPPASSVGVLASAEGGAKSYPMTPYMGLMHTAIGDELPQFFTGSEAPDRTLADIEAAYRAAAAQAGFLK